MSKIFHSFYKKLSEPEKDAKKIGLFRTLCAIFGGLFIAYLGMTFAVYIIPGVPGESILIPLLFNTFVWAAVALWISVSPTKLKALLRAVIPTIIFSILIAIFYNL